MIVASANQALALVRDSSHFQWVLLPIMLLVLHAYSEQAAAKRWSVVLAGLTFWLMDWVNEIINGLIAHFSGYAPLWGTPGASAYVLLIGLNLEISFMFAVMGLVAVRLLPADPSLKILGINNRWLFAVVNSILCVIVECWLNHIGALTWAWRGWNQRAPWLIFLLGYLPFYLMAYWVYDMPSRQRQITTVASLAALVAAGLGLFAGVLEWI